RARGPAGDRGRTEPLAPVPRRRDGEEQDRPDGPEVDGAPREEEDTRERVAAPVAKTEEPERARDRSERQHRPQERGHPGVERMQRRDKERQQRRGPAGVGRMGGGPRRARPPLPAGAAKKHEGAR